MAKTKQEQKNPMLGRNIPPPPVLPTAQPAPVPETTPPQPPATQEPAQPASSAQGPAGTEEKEKAGYEVRLYLTFSLDEKLEALRFEYKRRTGRKIKPNEIMRRLIEKATIEDLL